MASLRFICSLYLSSKPVQDQLYYYVFVDTTLDNLGDRWKNLVLPIHTDQQEIARISKQVEDVIRNKWTAQDQVNALRNQIGNIVT